ncbi:sensor histidine kinase [Pseudomonas sp. NBRC 111123]|uniref:sensor histidine kinase n=1 Tax=Pseudomonas sp. NBRC 111123 TaxID=1661038 RepID=UPI0035277F3D
MVANAIAYGAAGGSVTVCSRFEDEAIALTVHNTGTPLPAELLDDLFEPTVDSYCANLQAGSNPDRDDRIRHKSMTT